MANTGQCHLGVAKPLLNKCNINVQPFVTNGGTTWGDNSDDYITLRLFIVA